VRKLGPEMLAAVREIWGGRIQMVELLHPFGERLRSRRYPGLELTMHVFAERTSPLGLSGGREPRLASVFAR
jgi:hypothetical protein